MTADPPSVWDSIRDIDAELRNMRATQAANAERLVKVEERLANIQAVLQRLETRWNWAIGVLAGAFLLAIANWIIQGGLASIAKAAWFG